METTFEAVYKEHYGKLYTLAFRMTGNKEDAEDVLQTSFLNAYKAYEDFRNESSISTWLYRIVLNVSQKYAREAHKLWVESYSEEHHCAQSAIYDHIKSFGQVEDEALTNLTRETCLQMFMECMPSKYRAVYTLRCMLHFSVKETAEILEISENTVKVNLNRARKVIKSHIDGRCSLIQPGAMCDCRSFAKYLLESRKTSVLLDIEAVKNKERAATLEFGREMGEILEIEDMFDTQITPRDYSEFLKKIKTMRNAKHYKLLDYV